MVVGLRDRGVPLERTVILGAARTPFGRFGGALSPLGAPELGGAAIREAIARSGIDDGDLQHSIFGIVVQAGVGQIPSRQANFHAGLTFSLTTETLNQVCASGLRSATLAETLIRAGDYDVIVAGGMESMSNAPYLLPKARWGARMGDMPALDPMDGGGTGTAGNAPGVTDVAGALVLAGKSFAERRGLEPLGSIVAHAKVAEEPPNLLTVPGNAGKLALEKAGWKADDLDLVEINEAFAGVAIHSTRVLGVDPEIVNTSGGALAPGHPVGAGGGRIPMTPL